MNLAGNEFCLINKQYKYLFILLFFMNPSAEGPCVFEVDTQANEGGVSDFKTPKN